MSRSLRTFWCCLLLLGTALALAGCGNSVPPRVVPDMPAPGAAAKAMELYDANHDGFLDAKELAKAPGLMAFLERIDTGHTGKISEQQIADRIQMWADSRVGRTQATCLVTHNGKPLAGANVVFVPEPFLGGTLRKGSGKTTGAGGAIVSSPYPADPTVLGISPGFYRVEITKEGENIPAKYNTETTLGAEVAVGSEAQKGLSFDLKY